MQSEFSRDLADPDQPIKDAAAAREGPIKLRIQPSILQKNGQYKSWTDLRWSLECDGAAEALAVRDVMIVFFDTLMKSGPKAVHRALAAAGKETAA
jgi:hypothetical protein